MHPINNIHRINPIKSKIKDFPDDNINITPFLNYVNDFSPKKANKDSPSNKYYSSKKYKNITNSSSKVNQAYFDINNLTINHNTNLTNLNLYFLYNSEGPLNKDKFVNIISKKEPEDSIRKNNFIYKNHPKDGNTNNTRENNFNKRYHSIKYTMKERLGSKSPMNNTQSLYRLNKIKKKKKKKLSLINEIPKNIEENNNDITQIEPRGQLNLSEFIQIRQIGKGTFGKIFSVKWKKNDKIYALKKEIFNDEEFVEKRKNVVKIIGDFLKKTNNKGVIHIYSNLCQKIKEEYKYYELMELGEMDWEQEINARREQNLFYSEKELINISFQIIRTLSLMQKNHITHRDIKPQNILIVNGKYKLCDFGEIRLMEREGIVVQRIRGSELYMSPILFYGLRANMIQVKHNTYKSDVFSLGMCILYACTMYFNCTDEIREMTDMKMINNILNKYLGDKYSNNFISLIYLMLQIEEQLRPDFIQLEEKLNSLFIIK